MNFKFPKNFYWGSATSAHQVEGGNHNDWSEWEKENA
ncbi:MAG: glycoside hydrolase family 1, partial [Candidatus Moranbacteria bacterium GW2011_GWF2_37_7]